MKAKNTSLLIPAMGMALALALGLSSCAKAASATSAKKQSYAFATVTKASVESLVTSSGTLAVDSSLSVLAQMSGRIEKVNVDYNDRVKKGQLLATINTDLLKLQLKAAQAGVDKYQANYDIQALAVQNSKALFDKGLLSDYDYKLAQSTLKVNKAELASAQASLDQIETQINQYAYVTSPIDGIVLERDVDPGSSVVGGSSSNTTTLFTLAGSLDQMLIKAQVDELDISSIKAGQAVTFTVEANAGVTFSGTVKEVRLVPETSDNLVYYYVIIQADNKSGKLLPGMTASVNFIKDKRDNVLTVPSAALRFTPSSLTEAEKARLLFVAGLPSTLGAEEKAAALAKYDAAQKAAAEAKKTTQSSGITSLMAGSGGGFGGPGGPGGQWRGATGTQKAGASGSETVVRKPLWYLDEGGALAAVMVQVGLSDSQKTEIIGAEDLEGKKIILKANAE